MLLARSKAKAKAKAAAAAVARKNARRDARRAAATALNDLARECHIPEGGLLQDRNPSSQDVEAIVQPMTSCLQSNAFKILNSLAETPDSTSYQHETAVFT